MIDKNELYELIGSNIKREREKAGVTQDVLSEKIGLDVKTLSKIERGKVGISLVTLTRLCEELCVSSSVLLGRPSNDTDIRGLTEQLETLTPDQFALVQNTVKTMLRAFELGKQQM